MQIIIQFENGTELTHEVKETDTEIPNGDFEYFHINDKRVENIHDLSDGDTVIAKHSEYVYEWYEVLDFNIEHNDSSEEECQDYWSTAGEGYEKYIRELTTCPKHVLDSLSIFKKLIVLNKDFLNFASDRVKTIIYEDVSLHELLF